MGKSFAFLLIICLMILGGAYFFGGRLPGVSLGWNRINFDFSNFFKSSSTLERPNKDFEPKEFKAVVVNVHDGDTVTVVNDKNQKYKVRLWGIDAPELAQDGGQSSQRYLKNLIDAKEVDIMVQDVDKYSRLLAVIYLGDQMVNGEMVLAGHAWWYEHFAPNAVDLANYEQEARKYQRGLWRQKNPMPPWKFRQK